MENGWLRFFALSLLMALVGVMCIPALAQLNARVDASFSGAPSGVTMNSVGSAHRADSRTEANGSFASRSSAGWSSLPAQARQSIMATLRDDDFVWIQEAELDASDGVSQDWFGYSVAVDGTTVVVGAWGHTVGSNYGQGAVYVFTENGGMWTQQAELTSSDGQDYDNFGWSVAISGNTIAIGAICHPYSSNSYPQCGPGAVYVFGESGGTWTQQAELTASDGVRGDLFGYSVAAASNTIVIGADQKEIHSHAYQGAAYVFVGSGETWTQQAELTASDGIYNDTFGYSAAVNGSTAVIGAPFRTVGANQAQGTVYVFSGSGGTWTQQAELISSDGEAGDIFGNSVALDGSTAVIGAPCHPRNGAAFCQGGTGAAYVFVDNSGTWSQQAELTSSDGVAGDEFGISVALSGSTMLMGAPYHTFGTSDVPGAAYVFADNGGTWSQQAELTSSDGVAFDQFGYSVALSGSTAVGGSPNHPAQGGTAYGPGAAYVFQSVANQPALTLYPTSLNFGDVVLNKAGSPQTVTATNTGGATLEIASIAANGDFAISTNTCGATLAAGASCSVSVIFTPKALGARMGTLTFTDNAPNSPQTVGLSGTGVKVPPASLTPASAKYPKEKVGTTSKAKTFTLTNKQKVTLTGIAISTTGDYAVSETTCGTSLAAKGKCTIEVTFTPTAVGTRTGQLSVSDSAGNSPQTSSLTGTAD